MHVPLCVCVKEREGNSISEWESLLVLDDRVKCVFPSLFLMCESYSEQQRKVINKKFIYNTRALLCKYDIASLFHITYGCHFAISDPHKQDLRGLYHLT